MPAQVNTVTYSVETHRHGEFPTDMLRRDQAEPATQADADLIARLCDFGEARGDLPKFVTVHLKAPAYRGTPNVARWESFGCRVVACSDPTVVLSSAPGGLHPDDLREKLIKRIAEATDRLRGLVHMARPACDAIRFSAQCASRDEPGRQRAIGQCEGLLFVLESGVAPGLVDLSDVALLSETVAFVRALLQTGYDEMRSIYIGDRPTILLGKLAAMTRRLNASN